MCSHSSSSKHNMKLAPTGLTFNGPVTKPAFRRDKNKIVLVQLRSWIWDEVNQF